ncbi:MAG: tRNA preQ1(34) S-adenosylmethionine ribosyltransferase-isomerase QueA [Nitrospiraceae bacterium]|jgi:S-adenosylmethionine:tRNA ribosyltransferase-isomerase
MRLSDFDFPFDSTLIASRPAKPPDRARLLVMDRHGGSFHHYSMADLPSLLKAGDLVVVNDTKVMAARIQGRVHQNGKPVDMLFVRDLGLDVWDVMLKGRFPVGLVIDINAQTRAVILERNREQTRVRIEGGTNMYDLMREIGTMPLPPYIKRAPTIEDREWYQTMFARVEGAIAAPTAGLHFTEHLLAELSQRGIRIATVTLHVGPGTFRPVTVDRIEEHQMAAEATEVSEKTVDVIRETQANGGRIIAIGTTVTRALESAARDTGVIQPFYGPTDLFIRPGFSFHVINALLTNFHLPRTTLLMLVSALAGVDRLRDAYAEAVSARYRFYSYGDAMLIR